VSAAFKLRKAQIKTANKINQIRVSSSTIRKFVVKNVEMFDNSKNLLKIMRIEKLQTWSHQMIKSLYKKGSYKKKIRKRKK